MVTFSQILYRTAVDVRCVAAAVVTALTAPQSNRTRRRRPLGFSSAEFQVTYNLNLMKLWGGQMDTFLTRIPRTFKTHDFLWCVLCKALNRLKCEIMKRDCSMMNAFLHFAIGEVEGNTCRSVFRKESG